MKADLPIEAKAFLDALAVGESGGDSDPYHILYGGGHFTGDQFPQWAGKDNSHAAGRYQFEPATWASVAAKADLPDFSPDNQDAGAWWLAGDDYHRKTSRLLRGDLMSGAFEQIAAALQPTWTSLSPATFGDRYKAAFLKYAPPVVAPAPAPDLPATTDPRDRKLVIATEALTMIGQAAQGAVGIAQLALKLMETA